MQVRHLRHLLAVAQHSNFSEAARAIGISQPALSRSIAEIEALTGLHIFERVRGGMTATSPGAKPLLDRAAALLREFDEFERFTKQSAAGLSGTLSFGIAPSVADAFLGPLLIIQQKEAPDLRLHAYVRRLETMLPMLLNGTLELIIGLDGSAEKLTGVKMERLGAFPLSVIVRREHPILAEPTISNLGSYPLIITGRSGYPASVFELYGDAISRPANVISENIGALAQLALASDSVWVSSVFTAMDYLRDGRLVEVCPRAGREPWSVQVMLYQREQGSLASGSTRLRDYIQSFIAQRWLEYGALVRKPERWLDDRASNPDLPPAGSLDLT